MSLASRLLCFFVALLILAWGATTPAMELVATNPGGAVADKNGWDVTVDGDTIIVGAMGDAATTGIARVYVHDGSNWSYQASLLPAGSIANDKVGHGVTIQGDTAVVGARDSSSATIYTRSGTTWTEGKTLLGTIGHRFGNAVAIDGDWIAVGAHKGPNCYVSQFDGTDWSDPVVLDKSAATLGTGNLGYDVAMDGDWIMSGAFTDNAVHIWKYDSVAEAWGYHSGIDNGADGGYFGISVDVDGERAIIGARAAGGDDGKAYTYTYNSGADAWELQQTFSGELDSDELFGASVSLSGDTAMIGAYNADVDAQVDSGAAYIYKLSGGTWCFGDKIIPQTPVDGGTFGNAVACTDTAIAVGAPHRSNWSQAGKAYAFEMPEIEVPDTEVPVLRVWTRMPIDNDYTYTDGAHNILPYDLDGDGQCELVANSYKADSLQFYRYSGDATNASNWTRYVIDDNISPGNDNSAAHYTAIIDVNGDGRVDLISAENTEDEDVVVYLAPVDITNTSAWERHVLYDSGYPSWGAYHIDGGDVDGNGANDIAVVMRWGNRVGWLNNDGSEDNWNVTWVDTTIGQPFNVKIADFDNDGQNDMIASSIDDKAVYLYTYSDDPTNTNDWSRTTLVNSSNSPITLHIADLDQDGDLDILFNDHLAESGDRLCLLDNPYGEINNEWDEYIIGQYDAREIAVGDIDTDGDFDIVIADQDADSVVWFENNGMTLYENWIAHTIDVSYNGYLDWAHGVGVADIDNDGLLDIAVAAARGDSFQLYFQSMERCLVGDANADGKVDDADAMILACNWQTLNGATWSMGDFNGDGAVDDADATLLAANWQIIQAGAENSVPEPSVIFHLFGLICGYAGFGRFAKTQVKNSSIRNTCI